MAQGWKMDARAAPNAGIIAVAGTPSKRRRWRLYGIQFSYSGKPTNGLLMVTSGGEIIWQVDVTKAGYDKVDFDEKPLRARNRDSGLVVSLMPGGADVRGKVNIQYD